MARVLLDIADATNRLTLKAILEADGHLVVAEQPDLAIADTPRKAVEYASEFPALVLATAAEVRPAVDAMHKGVFGYLFVPFQPGEATIMIQRAMALHAATSGQPMPIERPEDFSLQDAEARLILSTLRHCKNNRAQAARQLGIARNTLWRKLKRIKKPQ